VFVHEQTTFLSLKERIVYFSFFYLVSKNLNHNIKKTSETPIPEVLYTNS